MPPDDPPDDPHMISREAVERADRADREDSMTLPLVTHQRDRATSIWSTPDDTITFAALQDAMARAQEFRAQAQAMPPDDLEELNRLAQIYTTQAQRQEMSEAQARRAQARLAQAMAVPIREPKDYPAWEGYRPMLWEHLLEE